MSAKTLSDPPNKPAPSLMRSASLLSLGNVASRVLGLLREMLITNYFGAEGPVSAFRVASLAPTLVYDALVGGMLSAALVPVLSDYAQKSSSSDSSDRQEFRRVVGILLAIFSLLLLLLVILIEITAPWIANLLAGGFDRIDPTLVPLTIQLIRVIAPAIFFFCMAGVITAVLYALQRFSFPALATSIYNLSLVLAAPLLAPRLGLFSLAIGILAGSIAQSAILLWDLQRAGYLQVAFVQFSVIWQHPAIRKILRLYAPIASSVAIATIQTGLDRRLASGTDAKSIAWMQNATTLQQLPLGLISTAIALASLPKLSQFFAHADEDGYRHTLGRGLTLVLLLIAPAAILLWLLDEPITRLLFQRGKFTAEDTTQVVSALHIYLIGMVFAAIDFPLNYAFYARNNTILPAIVGIVSAGVYSVFALWSVERMGYLGLVWGDTLKQAAHALIMLFFLWKLIGRLGVKVERNSIAILCASAIMAGAIVLVQKNLIPYLPSGWRGDLLQIAIVGAVGTLLYALCLLAFKMNPLAEARGANRERKPESVG